MLLLTRSRVIFRRRFIRSAMVLRLRPCATFHEGLKPLCATARIAMRGDRMLGALMGGISFHKGLGVVHSLSHALGATGRAHHGTLNAILLPHALRFNREQAEARMSDLAGTLGLGRS